MAILPDLKFVFLETKKRATKDLSASGYIQDRGLGYTV